MCKKHGIPISKWDSENYSFGDIMGILDLDKIDYNRGLGHQLVEAKYPNLIDRLETMEADF